MKNNKITEIAILLDKSGSMWRCQKQTVDGYNEYVDTLNADYGDSLGEVYVSLILFSSKIHEKLFRRPLKDLEKMADGDYIPHGATAMYDAVGSTIDKLLQETDRDNENVSYLVITMSDGQDTSSKVYSPDTLAEKIQELQDTGRWTFTYMGSNQDLSKIKELNIPLGNISIYDATPIGTEAAHITTSNSLNKYLSYRSSSEKSISATNFYNGK